MTNKEKKIKKRLNGAGINSEGQDKDKFLWNGKRGGGRAGQGFPRQTLPQVSSYPQVGIWEDIMYTDLNPTLRGREMLYEVII